MRRAIAALLLPAAAAAQQPQPQQGALEEITVTGTRIVRSGMVTPVPTTAVQAAELQNMSAGPLFDSLVQLPPFFANQAPEQVNGGQNSGGSNLNLRGAGLNRTLVLLDGRRVVPTNRFGAVDVAMFPEELVQSVEVVTGGASASYGTDAVAGVVNFRLDTDFEGFKGHAQMGETSYGDGETVRSRLRVRLRHRRARAFDGLDREVQRRSDQRFRIAAGALVLQQRRARHESGRRPGRRTSCSRT